MNEVLEKLNIESNEYKHSSIFHLKRIDRKPTIVSILIAGSLWLILVSVWKSSSFNFNLVMTTLGFLYTIYSLLSISRVGIKMIINEGNLAIHQSNVYGYQISNYDISKISTLNLVDTGKWLNTRTYDLTARLNKEEFVTLASGISIGNADEAMLSTQRINDMVKRNQLPSIERK